MSEWLLQSQTCGDGDVGTYVVLGHVALALARVSRLKLKRFPLRQALGNMHAWTVCNQIVYTPANGYEFLKFVSVSCIFRDS